MNGCLMIFDKYKCDKFNKHISLCICYALISVTVLTVYADGFDYFAQIKKYTKCEAVQNVMANILSESEQEFYQHELHYASLDSRIVALELAKAGGYQAEHIDELFLTYLNEYRNQLEQNEEVDTFIAALRPHVKKCRRLNEMQKDIIERKRTDYLDQGDYLP